MNDFKCPLFSCPYYLICMAGGICDWAGDLAVLRCSKCMRLMLVMKSFSSQGRSRSFRIVRLSAEGWGGKGKDDFHLYSSPYRKRIGCTVGYYTDSYRNCPVCSSKKHPSKTRRPRW
jgi:hypothetical protein